MHERCGFAASQNQATWIVRPFLFLVTKAYNSNGVHPGLLAALYAIFEEQGDDWIDIDEIHKKGTIIPVLFPNCSLIHLDS